MIRVLVQQQFVYDYDSFDFVIEALFGMQT